MTMIELHAIQSFAPANLNRDDVGAPKDCVFGGVPRARVSSQSWKRAVRVHFRTMGDTIELGVRTKRAHEALAARLQDLDAEVARHRAAVLLEAEPLGLSLKVDTDAATVKTGQLVFFREGDLDALAALAREHGDELDAEPSSLTVEPKSKKDKPVLSKEVAKAVERAMTTPGHALDVALFGRMVAEMPEASIDAACQVAHAVGTHRLASEGDYYTAVDDLRPDDTEGADMIGEIGFNASCFYRYAVIDAEQLAVNLGAVAGDEHVAAAITAFVRSFILSAPTGKQTSFAARNLPTAVLGVRRSASAPANLINAFVEPVRAGEGGIPAISVRRMLEEFGKLEGMYGSRSEPAQASLLTAVDVDGNDSWTQVDHLDDLMERLAHG